MAWVDLVTLLAVIQVIFLSIQVGRAHRRYGVKLPAMTGNEEFERYNRAHMNTVEWIVVFLPALWTAAKYWNPQWMALIGAVYLIGRVLYYRGYVVAVEKRNLGFALSTIPTLVLILFGLVGLARSLIAA